MPQQPTPSQSFRKLYPQDVIELEKTTSSGWFQRAVIHAQAEMSRQKWTPEKVAGANEFMEILTRMGEEEIVPGQLPEKNLTTFDVKPPVAPNEAPKPA